ncbi:hypothetical protein SLA2020_394720 [Shorea laevis]
MSLVNNFASFILIKELDSFLYVVLVIATEDMPVRKNQKVLDGSDVGDREDRISKLPNEVLSHVFSFLPTKDVVRTSILSKRWKYAWTSYPSLEFTDQFTMIDDIDFNCKLACFKDSVDHALFHHAGSAIEKCSFHCYTEFISPYLYAWVCAVLSCNVQELSIKSNRMKVNELPPSLFTCRTLVVLEIDGAFVLNLPFHICFPCLKTLSLESVIYGDDFSMQRFFSSCPALEDLEIRRKGWDGVLISSISVPSLKRLSIFIYYMKSIEGYEYKMEIHAPCLESLELVDSASKVFAVNCSNSLVKADVGGTCGPKILKEIPQVRELELSGKAFRDSLGNVSSSPLPIFHNLTHLELGVDSTGWNSLSNLLASTPNLEVLVFAEGLLAPAESRSGFHSFSWDPPESPPECVLLHLKQIEIYDFVGTPCERFLIRYLLEHGEVLDTVNICWHDFGPRARIRKEMIESHDKILSYSRASPSCEVEFFEGLLE